MFLVMQRVHLQRRGGEYCSFVSLLGHASGGLLWWIWDGSAWYAQKAWSLSLNLLLLCQKTPLWWVWEGLQGHHLVCIRTKLVKLASFACILSDNSTWQYKAECLHWKSRWKMSKEVQYRLLCLAHLYSTCTLDHWFSKNLGDEMAWVHDHLKSVEVTRDWIRGSLRK